MTFARQRERSITMRLDSGGSRQLADLREGLHDACRRPHRPDGVGTARSDADCEEIEHADVRGDHALGTLREFRLHD
ncbi:MAG: hypothetical protein ACLP9L_22745 [Thermoguttaceae bacterium]